jgi:uncharacterized protein (TIGR02145 family)
MKRKYWFGSLTTISIGMVIIIISIIILLNCSKDKNPVKPSTTITVTDIDGNVYQTVKIGNQWWMAENLKVTHYRNNNAIPNVTDSLAWSNLSTGAYCNSDNNETNVVTYGRLYNWFAINDSRNISPAGWHVPSDEEWKQLEMYLGMSQAEADRESYRGTDKGGKLKEAGTSHWYDPNEGATNESGFSALPGGARESNGSFKNYRGLLAFFWSSTEGSDGDAWCRFLPYDGSEVGRWSTNKKGGLSIRCVKD